MLSTAQQTILLVDDEPAVLGLVNSMLTFLGYRVLAANGPAHAIDIARREQAIDLLLSDVNMPEMDGGALASHLLQFCPSLRVLLMSGAGRAEDCGMAARFRLVRKPLSIQVLRDAVSCILSDAAALAC